MTLRNPHTPTVDIPPTESVPEDEGPGIDLADPSSPLAPFYLHSSQVVAFVLLIGFFLFYSLLVPLWHSDIWMHLKYGQWIVEHAQLPEREPFSPFSDPAQKLWDFQWLGQVILYLVYHAGELLAGGDSLRQLAGGTEMLRGFHGLLVAGKWAFLLAAFTRQTRSLPLACVGVVILAQFSSATSALFRPQILAEFLFAWLLWIVSKPSLSWRGVITIITVMTLWANVHGSFLVGFALLGILWFGRSIEAFYRSGWRAAVTANFSLALAGLLALVSLSVLNPYGWQLIPEILRFANHPNIMTMEEWKPLDFSQHAGGHWGYLALLVLFALSQVFSRSTLSIAQALVLLFFCLAPLIQQRMMIWFTMVIPWIMVSLGQDMLHWAPEPWRVPGIPNLRKTLLAAAVFVIAVVWSGPFQLVIGKDPEKLSSALSPGTPLAVAEQLRNGKGYDVLAKELRHYPDGKFQGRIFASEILGDFLVWDLPERPEVFTYSHVQVFPASYWEDYMRILFGKPGWSALLDEYHVNLVLVECEQRIELAAGLREDPRWLILRDDSKATGGSRDPRARLLIALRHPKYLAKDK